MARPLKPFYDNERQGWYIRPGGKRIRLADGPENVETRKQAEKAFHRRMAEETPLEKEDPELQALVETFLFHYQAEVTLRSFQEAKYILEEFLASLPPQIRVRQLLPFHLTHYISLRRDRWKSTDTQANVIKCIKTPLNWAVQQGLIEKNPFRSVTGGFGNRRRPVTEQEFATMLQGSPPHLQECLLFLYHTGCRPSELRSARWQDLDLKRGALILVQHKTARARRDRAPRMIVLTEAALEILITIRNRQQNSEYIFIRPNGRPWHREAMCRLIRKVRKTFHLPNEVKIYGIRHSFGTRAVNAGLNLKVLAELMGHTNTATTEHYVHLAGQINHLRSALSQIETYSGEPDLSKPNSSAAAPVDSKLPLDSPADADHRSDAGNQSRTP